MHLAKDKKCIVGGDHPAEISFNGIVSTIGAKPRRQKAWKSIPLCIQHANSISLRFEVPDEKTIQEKVENLSLCRSSFEKTEESGKVRIGASEASKTMNFRRWHTLKIGHKKKV